jgi:hypothetical protein
MAKPSAVVSDYGLRSKARRPLQDEQGDQNPNGVQKSTGCRKIRSPSPFQKQPAKRPVKKQSAASTPRKAQPIKSVPKKSGHTKKSSGTKKSNGTKKSSSNKKASGTKESIANSHAQKPSNTDAVQDPSSINTAQDPSNSATAQGPSNTTTFQEPEQLSTELCFFANHLKDPENWPLDLSWIGQEQAMFDRQQKRDHLIDKPTPKTSVYYCDEKGNPLFDNRYVQKSQRKPPVGRRHPKIVKAKKTGNLTERLEKYFEHLPPKINIPLAGNPKEPFIAAKPSQPDQSEPVLVRESYVRNEPGRRQPTRRQYLCFFGTITASKWASAWLCRHSGFFCVSFTSRSPQVGELLLHLFILLSFERPLQTR